MAKLIKCSSCEKEIAESAKTCPNCGAKVKKPIYKRVWFWVVIVLVAIVMFSGGDSESTGTSNTGKGSTEQQENVEYIKLDVDTLNDALENNAAAAKETYNKKYVEVTGKLSTIDSDLAYISIVSTTDEWDFMGIHCKIKNNKTKNVVKTLSKDQTITVRGKITDVGEVLGYYLDIIEIVTE